MSLDRTRPAERVAEHLHAGRGAIRVPYPIRIRRAPIVARDLVSPRMLRLTLGGPGLQGFHTYVADDHVKLVFPLPDGTRNDPVPNDEDMLTWSRPAPPTRAYTVRRFDPDAQQLDLDIVLHDGGLASDWAVAAQVGEEVVVAGPPGGKAFAHTHDHYVFAIDTTALPALGRWLDEATWLEERDVRVDVLIDHDHPDDTRYPLLDRPGVAVRWLDRTAGSRLAEEASGLAVTADSFVFAAGEAGDIKPLRAWVAEHGCASSFTGYWKRGVEGLDE